GMAVISRYVPVDLRGRRVVVVGASIAGLAAALALGERGADVTLVEADLAPDADSPEEAFASWSRRRVPQSRHSHAFLARLRNILVRAHPEFYAELLAAGAVEMNLLDYPPPTLGAVVPEAGDAELTTIGCRRTTFEWALRRHVAAAPWAEILSGITVEGLLAQAGDVPTVRGVRIAGEGGRARTIGADLVVDASGRTSRAPAWLVEIGAAAPYEERSPSAILYYTRFYRRRPGKEFPAPGTEPTMADFGWVKFAIFPADNETYSITFAPHLAFPRLKVLTQTAAFDELARAIPGLAPFADPELGEPISVLGRDVLAMGGLENFLRRFVDRDGRPLARGFFAIGDSAYHTNPLYGRGTSQAFMHSSLLGEALDAAAG
ncbi:MAG: NAD(P)/FAD-dependent oxidoreductase, partial [Candidatus Binatia bacterium]